MASCSVAVEIMMKTLGLKTRGFTARCLRTRQIDGQRDAPMQLLRPKGQALDMREICVPALLVDLRHVDACGGTALLSSPARSRRLASQSALPYQEGSKA